MICIEIAGAGAGKTYGLAEKLLLSAQESQSSYKKIFAITFTNKAKNKITETIRQIKGEIPDKIQVDTVHSFLLNEIILPFSPFILKEIYTKAVSFTLPEDIRFKQYKKKKLRESKIIHNEDVYLKAKMIVDRENSKHGNKKKRQKVDFILSHIIAHTESIFLDEVQDLDENALRIFEILGMNNIPVYMIGDPKQAIKYPKALETFMKDCYQKNPSITKLLPINNKSRRVPTELLSHSNRFCPADQCQESLSTIKGKLFYISSDSLRYDEFIKYFISRHYLIYIEEKQGKYNTHKENTIYFPIEVERKIEGSKNYVHLNSELLILATLNELKKQLMDDTPKMVIETFKKKFNLHLEPSEYAELKASLELFCLSKKGYLISSIDSVKGMESENCVFILNENTLNYFLHENLEPGKYHNKVWKKIYVALTRSSNSLIFALDQELLPNQNLAELKKKLELQRIFDYQDHFELPPI